jgi:hypothetical protein
MKRDPFVRVIGLVSVLVALLAFLAPRAAEAATHKYQNVWTSYIHRQSVFLPAGSHTIETRNTLPGGDPVLHVWDGVGASRWDDDANGAPNARIFMTVPAGGKVYSFIVHAYDADSTGNCDLYLDGTRIQTSMYFGGTPIGTGSSAIPGGSGYRYETALATMGAPDTYLYALSSSGAIIAADDDGGVGLSSRISSNTTARVLLGTFAEGQAGNAHFYVNDASDDADGDFLGHQLELALGTCDRAGDPGCTPPGGIATFVDSDRDGIDDAAEVFGVDDPSAPQYLAAWGANPAQQDVFIEVDWSTAFSSQPWPISRLTNDQTYFDAAPAEINLNGQPGIKLHYDIGTNPSSGTLYGNWGGANGGLPDGGVPSRGGAMTPNRYAMFRSMKIISGAGGGTDGGGSMVGIDSGVTVPAHELGHRLGLQHWGHDSCGQAEFKPNYKSIMSTGGWNAPIQFSPGNVTAVLDPGAVSERNAFPADPNWLTMEPWNLRVQTSGGNFDIDWNRDGQLAEVGTTPVRAGITWSGWDVASLHVQNSQTLGGGLSVKDASPRIVTMPGTMQLYVFFITSAGQIRYVHGSYIGPGWNGSCPGGGSLGDVCMSWSAIQDVPVSDAVDFSALEHGGKVVLAYRSTAGNIRTLYAAGHDVMNYNLTGWTSWGVLGAASGAPELTVMYVDPALYAGATEVIGVFYPWFTEYRSYSAPAVGGGWSFRGNPLAVGSVPIAGPSEGNKAPALVAWPGRDAAFGANRRTTGVFVDAAKKLTFYAYDKGADRWTNLTSTAFVGDPPTTDVRPTLVYHLLRDSAGVPLGDGSRGQFYLWWGPYDGSPGLMITERREVGMPPSATMQFRASGWGLPWADPLSSIAATEDSSLGAIKGVGLFKDAPPATTYGLYFWPLFDGTHHVTLRDCPDFRVLHRTMCATLRPPSHCGATNAWGY